jgi:Ca2+-binding RTX toxin-like protein
MSRSRPFLFAWCLLAGLVFSAPAEAATFVFPGCGPTLQKCVNAAPAGSTIKLRTDQLIPIANTLTIDKGLRIVAAPGYDPRLGSTGTPVFINSTLSGSTPPLVFRGIHFEQVSTEVDLDSGSDHKVVFEDNVMSDDTGSNGDRAIGVFYGGSSRGSLVVKNNRISSSGDGVVVEVQGGPMVITGNRVTSPVPTDSEQGINAAARGAGLVRAIVANNLVHDVSQCFCGNPTGMYFGMYGPGTLDMDVLNNTVVRAGENVSGGNTAVGMEFASPADPAGHFRAHLYNNLVTDSWNGIVVYPSGRSTIDGNLNDTYNVDSDQLNGEDIGTLLHFAPRYVDQSHNDFKIRSHSKLRDAGQTCIASTPIPRSDAARRFRVHGGGVDIGSFEFGSNLPGQVKGVSRSGSDSPDAIKGTAGVDVLCGVGGNDAIQAGGGRDFVSGGAASDQLFGGGGADRLYGDLGKDHVFGEDGGDYLNVKDGVVGNDSADGGLGSDTCKTDQNDTRISC